MDTDRVDPWPHLRTDVPERGLIVVSALYEDARGPSGVTAIEVAQPGQRFATFVWGRVYEAPVSWGGLDEAHAAVVEQVRSGQLPPPAPLASRAGR